MTSITPTPHVDSKAGQPAPPGRRRWLWVVLACVALAGVLSLAVWLIPPTTATQTETIDGPVRHLTIDITGGVSLSSGDDTELTVFKEWLFFSEPAVTVVSEDGVAVLSSECSWFQFNCTTKVIGTVSADAEIEVTTSAGSVEVVGTRNGVDLETSAGSISVDVAGAARLRSSAGAIVGVVTNGDVDAETSGGRIELTVLGDFASLSAITSAGNVELAVTDDVYAVDADTSAGSVSIDVRTDPAASRQIHAETSIGNISIRQESVSG